MNRPYIVYDSTGKIIKTGYCDERLFYAQITNDGESIIGGVANDATHSIDPITKQIIPRITPVKVRERKPERVVNPEEISEINDLFEYIGAVDQGDIELVASKDMTTAILKICRYLTLTKRNRK